MSQEAEEILEKLPEILRQSPELRYKLYDLLSGEFVTRREMGEILAELKASREEARERFDASERRFEAMDRRFEAMDRRFEAMDRRFEELRETMERRFEAMDRRFEAMDRRFNAMDQRFDAMDQRFDDADRMNQYTRDWVGVTVGGFQVRAGRSLEDAVAGTLRVALRMKDLDPETIKLRQKLEDTDGLIGPPGRTYEYDIFVANGELCVFEVKSVPDNEDVDRFADKCDLVARTLGHEQVRRVIVTLAKTPDLQRHCEERGVTLA